MGNPGAVLITSLGGILLSNGAQNLPFNLIATPNAPTPMSAGTPELLAEFVQQLKQLEVQ